MRRLGRPLATAALLVVAACNNTTVRTPLRSFDRPTDIALGCVQFDPAAQLFGPRPLADCAPGRSDDLKITDDAGLVYRPRLRGLVTNSARGELAMVDISTASIIDLDRRVPGFGFLPIGKLPERVRASRDGCVALTANVDSCDLARVELPTLYNMPFKQLEADGGAGFGDDVVHRLVATRGGVPLGARPTWVELGLESQDATGPFDPGGTAGQCVGGSYRAWVAMPGCGLVAELDVNLAAQTLDDGRLPAEIVRALRFGGGTPEWVTDLSSLTCAQECAGEQAPTGTTGRPVALALVDDGSAVRLLVADQASERLTIATLDRATGGPGALRQIALESGARGLSQVKVSPRTPAGRFAYAIALDSSIRVIDLDRELECDTAIDGRQFSSIPPNDPLPQARALGCFPVGDPATPRRAARALGPGLRLPGDSIPTDVAFIHLDVQPPITDGATPLSASPTFLVGDFAVVTSTDARAALVQIYDACPAPNVPLGADNSFTVSCAMANVDKSRQDAFKNPGHPVPVTSDRLSHKLRGGANRFFSVNSLVDSTGAPRLPDPLNPFAVSINGVPAAELTLPDGKVTRTLPRLVAAPVPKPPYITSTESATESVRFFDPHQVFNQTWIVAWEGILPATRRTLGRPLAGGLFRDTGAAFCQRGVQVGDKLDLIGCSRTSDCNRTQVCVRDPAAPIDQPNGLCLDSNNELEIVQKACGPLLRAVRHYRILRARQEVQQPTGERSDELQLDEIYEPEYALQTRVCTLDSECADIKIAAEDVLGKPIQLDTQCLSDTDGQSRCLRRCDTQGMGSLSQCGEGYLCARSRRGDDRCMRAPLDDGLFAQCLKELQRYEIRVGSGFLVGGSTAGAANEMRIDPVTRDCVVPPITDETGRLQRSRIPLEAPACPALADPLAMLPLDSPNACLYPDPMDRIYHFENAQVAFALLLPADQLIPAANLILSFIVVGGSFPFTVQLARGLSGDVALLPRSITAAPDGQTLYVVDEGKSNSSTGLRGQVLLFNSASQSVDARFIVR